MRILAHQQFAKWEWTTKDGATFARLECILGERNSHPQTHIKAYINPSLGTWRVEEDGKTVAMGKLNPGDPLWRDGKGAQLEAERVITSGATSLDTRRTQRLLAIAKENEAWRHDD